MLPIPERGFANAEMLDQVKPLVMRMLDANEDIPVFVPLKKILIRPFFVDSVETAFTIARLHRIILIKSRKCLDIHFFDALLGHLTPEEKARHVVPLVDMFKRLMTQHKRSSLGFFFCCNLSSRFVTLYVEVLRGAEEEGTSEKLVLFIEYLMGTIPVWLGSFLLRMDPNIVNYLLTCFSAERFHAKGIRESNLLMKASHKNMYGAVLIRYGFKYSFDICHYKYCVYKIFSLGTDREAIVNYDAFVHSGLLPKLRMQMAVEILVHLLCHEHGIEREFLWTLWESLPDPFITPDELYHLMQPFFRTSALVDVCARYRDLFPWVPSVKQPRSLEHLARVRIRESLVRALTIGEKAVRSLGLLRMIEDYLWIL